MDIPTKIEFPDTVKKVRFHRSGQSLIVTRVEASERRPKRSAPDTSETAFPTPSILSLSKGRFSPSRLA